MCLFVSAHYTFKCLTGECDDFKLSKILEHVELREAAYSAVGWLHGHSSKVG